MVLIASALLRNLIGSLNAYIQAELVTAGGLSVLFPEQPPWDTLPIRWVTVDYLPMEQRRETTLIEQGMGHERRLIVNCNCYEQDQSRLNNSGSGTLYTLGALVDKVRAAFTPLCVIPIRDYTTAGNPIVDYFQWREQRVQWLPYVQGGIPASQINVSTVLGYEEAEVYTTPPEAEEP